MSKTKAGGSTKLGRDSESKRLGVKVFGGQTVTAGSIIVRQRGTKFTPGAGVALGNDYTIYALTDGMVSFDKRKKRSFTGGTTFRTVVKVISN